VEVNATGLLDLQLQMDVESSIAQTTCLEVDSFSNQLDQSQQLGIDDEDRTLNLARRILRRSLSETLFSTKLNRGFDFTNERNRLDVTTHYQHCKACSHCYGR
jgi:hypothetical protein